MATKLGSIVEVFLPLKSEKNSSLILLTSKKPVFLK